MGAGARVGILGPIELDGVPVAGREAAVVVALAQRWPAAATVDDLLGAVWGEDPPVTARKSLQNVIGALRRRLGADAIATIGDAYRLAVPTDVTLAEELHRSGRSREALALWRGAPDVEDPTWRSRLEELRVGIEDDVARQALAGGELADAIARLETGVAETPYREARWALLISALAAAGRQADALRAAQRARSVLAEDLGLEPGPALRDAERAVLDGRSAPHVVRTSPNPATPLHGRSSLLAEIRDALGTHRVVTLTGPGGVGKTRLALELAVELGACVVDLSAVARPDRVWEAVAGATGIAIPVGAPADVAVAAGAASPIVLDNCEHVLEQAAAVAERMPVRVLATSREHLGIDGERVILVPSLERDAAVRVYSERTGAGHDASVVGELCARLDDLPLAIELAAGVAPAIGPGDLLRRLDDRFAVLDGRSRRGAPRHRALRNVVDWSFDLLTPDEQLLFERLSAFRGRFSLSDAEALAADDRLPQVAVAPALARLVAASMVSVEGADDRRFRLLETFREYGRMRMGDHRDLGDRHLEWVAGVAARAAARLEGPGQDVALQEVGEVLADVEVALRHCAEEGPAATGLQVAGQLYQVWMARGLRGPGLRWLEHFALAADDVPAVERCRALHAGGMIAMMVDLPAADRLGAAAMTIAAGAGDRDATALAEATVAIGPLWRGETDVADRLASSAMPVLDEPQHEGSPARIWDLRAWVAAARGDLPAARAWHGARIAELEAAGERHMLSSWLSIDADLLHAMGDPSAPAVVARALELARAVGCRSCEAAALTTTALARHDACGPEALRLLEDAIALLVEIDEQLGLSISLDVLAAALVPIDLERAGRAWGAWEAVSERFGSRFRMPGRLRTVDPIVTEVADDPRWEAGVIVGRTMTPADVLAARR